MMSAENNETHPVAPNDPFGLVSIIVPIYNAEPYLELALLTVENQLYKNLEIICLNDGSTDASLETIRRHGAEDDRYVVIDKANEGYGATCNRGIAEAHGQWIAIVEPDDWIDLAMYRDMLAFASTFEEPLDIIKTPYWRVWMPDTKDERIFACSYKGLVSPEKQPFRIADEPQLLRHHPSIWSALYRKSFLDEFEIRFPELPGASWADNPFLVETLCQARAIAYLDRPYYYYREETPAQYRAFTESQPYLPLERWHDMQDILERIGNATPSMLKVQYEKGFIYLERLLSVRTLDDAPTLKAVTALFDRMDDAIVLSDDSIAPRWRRLFADTRGIPAPQLSEGRYGAQLIKRGLKSLKANGVRSTLATVTGALNKKR